MTPPPIPQRLAHRPTVGGLVEPYISMRAGERVLLGQVKGIKVARCIVEQLCQICGRPLIPGAPFLFLGTQHVLDEHFSAEPALHPECAAYSMAACPMINGSMRTYSKHPFALDGRPCDDPGCDCTGYITHNPESGDKAGQPAEPWHQIWITDYTVGVRKPGPLTADNVTGAVLTGRILKIREILRPGTP